MLNVSDKDMQAIQEMYDHVTGGECSCEDPRLVSAVKALFGDALGGSLEAALGALDFLHGRITLDEDGNWEESRAPAA